MRLDLAAPASEPTGLTSWMEGASDVWIDRTGEWIIWIQDAGPGSPGGVVVSHGGQDRRLPLPGYAGDSREFYGGEVSSTGVLAAPTAHGPWQGNELCVIDVTARLSALAAASDEPVVTLP